MKTFKQFILEDKIDRIELIDLLKDKCLPFLNATNYSGNFLLRAVKNYPQNINTYEVTFQNTASTVYELSVRKDRKPLSFTKPVHKKLDDWFFDNFGVKHRSQSLFCFGNDASPTQLRTFGAHTIAIFPMGDFKFAWSENVGDLYDLLSVSGDVSIDKQMRDFKFKDTDLVNAIKSNKEIMINCDKYLAIPISSIGDRRTISDYIKNS